MINSVIDNEREGGNLNDHEILLAIQEIIRKERWPDDAYADICELLEDNGYSVD